MDEETSDILSRLFQRFEELAPIRKSRDCKSRTLMYSVEGEKLDDSRSEDEDWTVDEAAGAAYPEFSDSDPKFRPFSIVASGPLVAVDCGCKKLGETENGLVIALRAAVIIDDGEVSRANLYRTGPLYLSHRHKAEIFHAIGSQLGEADYYVTLDDSDPPKPTKVKGGVADKAVQFSDRFRALLERLVQRVAVTVVKDGTVLFDGALTLRTRDCPDSYLRGLATLASKNGNSIIAVSKTSDLLVSGKSVRFWLDDVEARSGYRDLTPLLRQDNSAQTRGWGERVLGNVYSARFSALGPTFRTDVKPPKGGTDKEALDQFFSSTRMRGGYPDILVRAHALSYFSSEAVIQLQAQACAQLGLRPRPEVSLAATFSPFGGRYK